MLVGEKRTGAAHSGLHLVQNQQGAMLGGDVAGGGEVAIGRDDAAGPVISAMRIKIAGPLYGRP